jgi:kinesin family protein 1
MAPGGGNIKVVVRVRPFNSRENARNATCIVSMKETQTVLTPPPAEKGKAIKAALEGSKTFAFDKSYWSFDKKDPNYAGQENLFTDLGRPLLDNAFQGYNNCIFAYGQTGSGKSYSMMGYGEEEGVIPKICRNMFERIDVVQGQDKNVSCTVEVSYLEIYNERVRDLLNPTTKGNLKVREHPSTGPYVEDLAKLAVRSFAEIDHLMDEGNKARTVAATNMNETSSRSHAVFTLTLSQKRHDVETNMDTEKVAKISLVDLAGSERATSTGATGARLKEGAEINRSLSTLGRVIAALADLSSAKAKSKPIQVPYRDSVLTWLLKDSLGGNSMTAMIAAISPADINFEETLSTLRYADSAKRIKNHAVVNEDPNARMIRELKEELAQLRSKLSTGGSIAEEQYSADTPLEKQIVSITQADGTIKKVSKADIAEQLSQSEKLYKDLNQTWEEKLTKTELIHKEREAALEELGISIEKGNVGLSTPKKMPHLVNLSDDPLLAECLVYNLKPGTTTVGNVETNPLTADGEPDAATNTSVDIRLNGSKILHDHCTFENVDGVVTVIPKDGAAVMVNGIRIDVPNRLRSGYRVILGDFHIFRFNHPQEAREERAEQGSLLKYSVTADELDDTPSRRPGHDRSASAISGLMSDFEGGTDTPGSPAPWRHSHDNDWAFARREAISSTLGPDQKMSDLTDDQLDVLFEDLQRVRAVRRGRSEGKLLESIGGDTDTESIASHPVREKYLSNGTLDNFSLDTMLTIPSTPQHGEEEDKLRQTKDGMQAQLDKTKEEFEQKLGTAEEGSMDLDAMRLEKAKMEESLQEMKVQMQRQLAEQKANFHRQMSQMRVAPKARRKSQGKLGLSERDTYLAKYVIDHWKKHRYVAMAANALKNASTLKEAQIMSQQMKRNIVFQFTVVDVGHTFGSSYDLVLTGMTAEDSDDPELENAQKPCLGVRVIDFNNLVVTLWSMEKLHKRVRAMRQTLQYLDRPEYMQHFSIGNPFDEDCMPEYTRVGDANIPLAAVFECRVQDFNLDVYSPYTSSIVGVVRLSLEPSSAEAPSNTLKFNVVMHELIGFAEREGTNVHAQLFIPGVSEEDGATTTSWTSGFGEGAVRFESVHSMSLPLSAPPDANLRVSIFAKVTTMHLDKLLSWDDMRDASITSVVQSKKKRKHSRIPEHEYYSDERHDVFARLQILEINEEGNYQPVEVVQSDTLDQGAYQLHQGLQRRIVLSLVHYGGNVLPWKEVDRLQAGQVRLLDSSGKVSDIDSNQADVILSMVSPAEIRTSSEGTTKAKITCQWESSAHHSVLLDRPQLDKNRVQLTLKWQVESPRVTHPLKFSFDFSVQTRPRTWFRQASLLGQLFYNQRVVRSTASNYCVTLKPSSAKRVGDLWRMDTTGEYISGQEMLSSWAPRGVSLIRDFMNLCKQQRRTAEIESARGILSMGALSPPVRATEVNDEPLGDKQTALLQKYVDLWQTSPSAGEIMLLQADVESPRRSARTSNGSDIAKTDGEDEDKLTPLAAVVERHLKSPTILKAGWLLCPDPAGKHWVRTYVELRRPYLHLFSKEGDEVNAINLTNSRIDADPQIAQLLQRPNLRMEVWAVYATNKAWLFACRNDTERGEWIWAVDRSYVERSIEGTGTHSPDDDEW